MQTQATFPTPRGMTPDWADRAVHRAKMNDKIARRIAPGQWIVSSASTPGLWYLTTKQECTCPGHRRWGRCDCRALVAWEEWMRAQETAHPIAPESFIVRRSRWTPELLDGMFREGEAHEDGEHLGQRIAKALDAAADAESSPDAAA